MNQTEAARVSSRFSPPDVSFREATLFWAKLGLISFGGPAGQIAIMHRELVERRRWISEDRFLHALNYCMLLPGPEAQQLATYIGWLLHRVPGGIVAGVLFVLPSVAILLALSYLYVVFGQTAIALAVLEGVRPVVVAIVVEAVIRIGKRAFRERWNVLMAAAAFIAIYVAGVPFPVIVIGAALLGWLISRTRAVAGPPEPPVGEPPSLTIHDAAPLPPHTLPSTRRAISVVLICLLLWLAGLAVLSLVSGAGSLHVDEYQFFTKTAFVTFGGAYAVLAYVTQTVVEELGWISHAAAVDGLALAETTPGPLIMVVQFIGFAAAWNHPVIGQTPLQSATIGALATTWATFLPCFLFIFLGAPYIEKLRSNRDLNGALRGVTAAVVGVILNLAIVFGAAVLLPEPARLDWQAAALAVLAFAALWKYHVDVLVIVLGGAVAGLLLSL